jgi:hypothetical protein
MGRGPAARAAMVIGALLLFGIVLRLLTAILAPVLPPSLMQDIDAGWVLLHGLVAPAFPAIIAVAILGAIVWAIMGWWRRY